MVARFFRNDVPPQQHPSGSEGQVCPSSGRCAYCVPAKHNAHGQQVGHDECLIKMLGSEERKQVSLALYRTGRDQGLFDKQCPMSDGETYDECPFFESESEMGDD